MSETAIVKECLQVLNVALPGIWWRSNTGVRGGVRFGFVGQPDISGVLAGGIAGFVECKTATGKISQHQLDFCIHARNMGAFAVIVRSGEELLKEINLWKTRS